MCRYYCAIFIVLVQPQSVDWNLEHIIGLTEFDERFRRLSQAQEG